MENKKILLSLCIASALSSCGGGGGGKDKDPVPAEKKSLVCLDVNMNAKCDAGETSEKVVTWDKESPVIATLTGAPLAYKGENGYIFTAPAGFTKIYAGTTMLNNELIYNQLINNKIKADAKAYVHAKFIGGKPSTQNKADIAEAIKANISAHPNKSRYAVIAAVMNKIMVSALTAPDNIKNIRVTAQEIVAADIPSLAKLAITESASGNVDDDIVALETAGWVDSKDASIRYLSAKNGKVVGGSHYHNSLSVMDASSGSIAFNPVSSISDSGHGKDSVSGASENHLIDTSLSSDASYVYANIPPKKSSSTSNNKDTFGLYRSLVNSDNTIPVIKTPFTANGVSGEIISFDPAKSTRLAKVVSQYTVASDDSKVALIDSEKNLYVYSGDLGTEIAATDTFDNIGAMAVSSESLYIAQEKIISKLSTADLSSSTTITLGFEPNEILLSEDGKKLVAFNHGHDNNGETSIAVITLADNSIEASSLKATSDTAVLSPDATKMALVGHEMSNVVFVNLTVPGFSTQGVYSFDGVRDAAFVANDKLAIVSSRNGISVLDIATTTTNNNLDAKLLLAKEGLNKASMNHGADFDVVIRNMSLSKSFENVNIEWTQSGLGTNLVLPNGDVTRPAKGTADISGALSAALSATYRGVEKTESKDFSINIRKTPKTLAIAKSILAGRAQYMASNRDGSTLVAPIEGADKKYGIASFSVNSAGDLSAVSTPVHAADEYIVGVGITPNQQNAIAVAAGEKGSTKEGKGRIYLMALDANGSLGAEGTSVDITGTPQKVEYSDDGQYAAVMIKESDDTFITKIFSTVALANTATLDMGTNADYKDYGPAAVNHDGTKVFQRDGEKVYAIDATGVYAETTVEDIARVWAGKGRIYVHTYHGTIHRFNGMLKDEKIFDTGTGGRMYGGEIRSIGGKDYLIVPVQRSSADANGIYYLEISSSGLKETAFSHQADGADRMAVSGDGLRVFFSHRGSDKKRRMAVVTIGAGDL